MANKFKRTRLWVDPPFQGRLLFWVAVYILLYSIALLHIGFVFDSLREIATRGVNKGLSGMYLDYFSRQWPVLLTFLLTVPILLYDLLKLSHRIAGPLFRCRKVMEEMAAGKPVGEFVPRKHDLMRDLFQAFNALIRTWNTRVSADRKGHSSVDNTPPLLTEGTYFSPDKNSGEEQKRLEV